MEPSHYTAALSGLLAPPGKPTNHEPGNNDKKTRSKSLDIDGTKYRTRLNAKFDKVPLDTVLESICLAFDLDHKQINGRIQIVSNNTK